MRDSLTLIDMRRAFESERCLLCVYRENAERRYLWYFAHEGTNDAARLARLVPARGFCSRHASVFADLVSREHGDAMGVANSYRYVVERLIVDLKALQAALSRAYAECATQHLQKLIRKHIQAKSSCPACVVADQSEQHAIACLLDVLRETTEDHEWRHQFEKGAPFCWKHLLAVLEQCDQPAIVEYIAGVQLPKWEHLHDELAEYLRKCDYRFQDEPKGTEQNSWRRSLEMFKK